MNFIVYFQSFECNDQHIDGLYNRVANEKTY